LKYRFGAAFDESLFKSFMVESQSFVEEMADLKKTTTSFLNKQPSQLKLLADGSPLIF
jgi:hypothetical protein